MTVSTITILAPFDGFDSSDLRPHVNVSWAGGTGPFDVLYEWDDNTSFTSPLTDNNIGVTSPNEGIPPSDMGGFGTPWYFRVTVFDTFDESNEIQTILLKNPLIATVPTATASHTSGGNVASRTVDGNLVTDWQSGVTMVGNTVQLNYDFGAAVNLGGMTLLQSHSTDYTDSAIVYWSDDASGYTSVGTFNSLISGLNTMLFTAASHRYWRIEDNSTRSFWWRVNEVEFLGDVTTGGTFRLSYGGAPTGNLAWDVSLVDMATALEGLAGITDVTVTGTAGESYVVEFVNPALTDVSLLVLDDNSLTPTLTPSIVETVKGSVATSLQEPVGSYRTLTFTNPTVHPRHLYLNHNIGVGFGYDAFDGLVLGDGDPKLEPRFLYLNHNVNSLVPVPWIRAIEPTILSQGDGLIIYGQGFDNVARDWTCEARLYDSVTLDGGFVALSETGFVAGVGAGEDTLTVTVPGGAATGWVVVMNDDGIP